MKKIIKFTFRAMVLFYGISAFSQSTFEMLLLTSDFESEIGTKCIQNGNSDLYISSTTSSNYTIGGSVFYHNSYNGAKIRQLNTSNGSILSSNVYSTASFQGEFASSNIYNATNGAIILPFTKTEYANCGTESLEELPISGLYKINSANTEFEEYLFNTPCEGGASRFTHFGADVYSSFYKKHADSLFFMQRDDNYDVILNKHLPDLHNTDLRIVKSALGYTIIDANETSLTLYQLDEYGDLFDVSEIEIPFYVETYIRSYGYINTGSTEIMYFTQKIDDVIHSHIITFSNNVVITSKEFINTKIIDVCVYGSNILAVFNDLDNDCENYSNKIKVNLMNENLDVVLTGNYGLEYTTANDIMLTDDNHFVITGTKYIPSACLADEEKYYSQVYVLKESLESLNIDVNNQINKFTIHPNPASIELEINNYEPFSRVMVMTVLGEVISEISCDTNSFKLNLNNYNNGFYLIGIKVDKEWHWEKILKNL